MNQVIANTPPDHRNKPIQVTSTDQLLALANLGREQEVPAVKRSAKDEFVRVLFRELFREARFFYRQYKTVSHNDLSKSQVRRINHRIEIILDAIGELYSGSKRYLLEKARGDDNADMETAVFILGSLDADNPKTKALKQLFEIIREPHTLCREAVMEGLKQGRNQGINTRLAGMIRTSIDSDVRTACADILLNRQIHHKIAKANP